MKTNSLFQKMDTIWERIIESYLSFVEKMVFQFFHAEIAQAQSKVLAKIYILFFVGTVMIFLFGCATGPEKTPNLPVPQSNLIDPERSPKKADPFILYKKNNDIFLERKNRGSKTGSIFADSEKKIDLVSDKVSILNGDIITIAIDNSFISKQAKPKAESKPAPDKKETDEQKQKDDILLKNLEELGESNFLESEPSTAIKAVIIGSDERFVYLKSKKEQTLPNQNTLKTVLLAKVPAEAVKGNQINASDVTDLEISTDSNGISKSHRGTGWSTVASKYWDSQGEPTLNDQSYQQSKQELIQLQKSLRDQAKALIMERERIRKEAARSSDPNAKSEEKKGTETPNASNAPKPVSSPKP